MGIYEDARESAALPGGPARGALTRVWTVGQLLSVNTSTQRAKVVVDNGQPVDLPYLPGTYTGYTTALVLCDPQQGGRAVLVLGPAGVEAEPPAPPPTPGTSTATATILPTSTGTWRTNRLAWDRYTGGDGAVSDLYQGPAASGGGTLIGLATYGDHVANLGALSITAATVTLVRVGTGATAPVTLTVQGSPHGSRPAGAPTYSGDTASIALSRGRSWALALPATTREGLRTGAFKALALVGAAYAGAKGITHPAGMALSLTYTRPA